MSTTIIKMISVTEQHLSKSLEEIFSQIEEGVHICIVDENGVPLGYLVSHKEFETMSGKV